MERFQQVVLKAATSRFVDASRKFRTVPVGVRTVPGIVQTVSGRFQTVLDSSRQFRMVFSMTAVVYDNAFMLFSRRPIRKQLAYWLWSRQPYCSVCVVMALVRGWGL